MVNVQWSMTNVLSAVVDDDVGKGFGVAVGLDVIGQIDDAHLCGSHKIVVNPVDAHSIRHRERDTILSRELTNAVG